MAKYRVAVIGRTGRGNYGHGLDVVWKEFPNCQIVAVADEDAAGRASAEERLAAKGYADYREMLAKERPQIVSVAPRWIDCHRDMVVACAQHGCHVFVEKPLCATLAEADEMIDACERAHVKTAISHQTRYSPRIKVVKELIAAGRIGEVIELRGRGKEDRRGGGEDLMVLGTHIMDLMRWLVGNPAWCFAKVTVQGRPIEKKDVTSGGDGIAQLAGDRIDAAYGFDNALTGYFASTRKQHGAGARFGLRIFGTKGVIETATGSLPDVYLLEDPKWSPGRSNRSWVPVTSAGAGKPEPLKDAGLHLGNVEIVKDLLHAIETDTQAKGSIYDGRAALEMILAVYESQRLGHPVPLPLKNRQHPLGML
jgi:predicted dehydrogenase